MVSAKDFGLPTIRFVRNPSVEESDTVEFFRQEQRDALVQQQYSQDRQRGIRKMENEITQIETKLAEIKQQLVADESELARLRQLRAQLFVEDSKKHKAEIVKSDAAINKLRNFITNTPACIVILEEQLVEANAKFAAEARDELLNTQKVKAKEVVNLGTDLVAKLKAAVESNQKLHTAYAQYKQIHDLTKVDLLGSKMCEPSQQMLDYLYGFLKGELEDGKHCRLILSPPSPQI